MNKLFVCSFQFMVDPAQQSINAEMLNYNCTMKQEKLGLPSWEGIKGWVDEGYNICFYSSFFHAMLRPF